MKIASGELVLKAGIGWIRDASITCRSLHMLSPIALSEGFA